ncbi:hypothetical protein BH23ACT1_BH23ACT1_14980 [soil metagenome]
MNIALTRFALFVRADGATGRGAEHFRASPAIR